jgi:hypothetical protein
MVVLLSASVQKPMKKDAPIWLTHLENGVVASCGFYIGGHYSTAECAIQRGRERLAASNVLGLVVWW